MAELLNGRYELGDIVGSGGTGAVYRAVDTRLGRIVAIKALRGGPLADDNARARMRSEANLAASINHPGVAQVFDYEDSSDSHGGMSFIVMQFVEGHTLAQLLRKQGPIPPDQVMLIVVQVAEGLQAAHEAGIIHRDLKPANIMLTPAGRTVLVDFGIARSADSEPLTNTGTLIGTADYMSPEQAAGQSATPQSDLYSLGIVAYHCLTGTSPFKRDSHIATALAHLNDDLPTFGPNVPENIIQLVRSLTSKEPSGRPVSAAAVVAQAAAIGAAEAIDLPATFEMPAAAEPTAPDSAAMEPASTAAMAGVYEPRATSAIPVRKRRRWALYAVLTAAILVLAATGTHLIRSGQPSAIPNVVGMNVSDAVTQIETTDRTASRKPVDIAGKPAGQVVKQTPVAGQTGRNSASVTIFVATGKVKIAAKDVIGLTYSSASQTLEELGFAVKRADIAQSTSIGKVVALDKSGRLLDGAAITLSVAIAPAPVPTQTRSSSSSSSNESTKDTGTPKGAANKGKDTGKGKGKK